MKTWLSVTLQDRSFVILPFMPRPTALIGSGNRWIIAIAVMSSAIMEVIDTSVVNVSLPRRAQFHQDVLAANLTPGSLPMQQMLQGMTRFLQFRGYDPATAAQKADAMLYQLLQQQASLLSYMDLFHLMGILFLVVIPLIVIMRRTSRTRPPLKTTPVPD